MAKDKFFMAFDSETGGFNPSTADLLTFYAGIFDEDYKLVEDVYLKLKPNEGRLPIAEAQALRVNGIDLRGHMADPETITYAEGKVKLITLLHKYLQKTGRYSNIEPLGYNVPFDIRWGQYHLLPQDEWESILHYQYTDVMQNVGFLKKCGWFPSDLGSLSSVVDYLQLPKRGAHNSKEDTLMTVDVHKKLLQIMASKKEGGSTQDLISLLEAE